MPNLVAMMNGTIDNNVKHNLLNIPKDIQEVVAKDAIIRIDALNRLGSITKGVVRSDEDIIDRLAKATRILDNPINTGTSKAQLISSFNIIEDNQNIFEVFGYPCSKEELVIFVAFSGLGKTRLMLSLLKRACNLDLNCLYISIADWSESSLKRELEQTKSDFPDFYCSVYSDCGIADIDSEISNIPDLDIVFVDYMSVVRASSKFGEFRHNLGWISSELKRIAQEHNVLLITAHQSNKMADIVTADELAESKFAVLKACDMCLGIGGSPLEMTRNISTIKARNHKIQDIKVIELDMGEFEIYED